MAEELREVLAEGDPFGIEPAEGEPWTHVVSYEDVIAHEFEEGVERSVAALAAVEGVRQVVHEDREVLLVEAPGVADAVLARALRTFWRAEAARPSSWAPAFDAHAEALAPALKAAGFRRRKARWNRAVDDGIVHVIELDTYDNGEGRHVLLSLGVFVPLMAAERFGRNAPTWVREHDCQLRVSSWTLGGGAGGGAWPIDDGPRRLLGFVQESLLPFLDARRSLSSLLAADAGAAPGTALQDVDRAIGLHALGRDAEAQAEMDAAFAGYPRAYEHLRGVAQRLGLQAPATPPPIDGTASPAASGSPRRRRGLLGWFRRP